MRKCKWCGKSGLLLSVSQEGLCKKCESEVRMQIVHATRVLHENIMLLRQDTDPDVCIERGELAIAQLQELLPYYEKGLLELKPSPQEWVARIYHTERHIIDNHIKKLLAAFKKDIQRGISQESRVERLQHVLEVVNKYKPQLGEAKATDWKKRIEAYMSTMLLKKVDDPRMDEAQRERTIDQYLEALDILRADDTGEPEHQNRIEEIKSRIKQLGGTIPAKWEAEQSGDGMPSKLSQ